MSRSAVCSTSKGIDGISCHGGTDVGFEPVAAHHINLSLEQTRNILFKSDIPEHCHARLRVDLNHDVEVAVGPVGATRHRAKHGGVPDAARAQIAFVPA